VVLRFAAVLARADFAGFFFAIAIGGLRRFTKIAIGDLRRFTKNGSCQSSVGRPSASMILLIGRGMRPRFEEDHKFAYSSSQGPIVNVKFVIVAGTATTIVAVTALDGADDSDGVEVSRVMTLKV